jgi:flavin-dependent dehydrogenase
MNDVVIAGAGPAGCVAAIVLARAGARVLMLDRARFPRPKLCGDSLNPGAVALLGRLDLAGFPEDRAVRADGILVSGEGAVRIEARYPPGVQGRFVSRIDLDSWLLDQALAAGVQFEDGARVVAPLLAAGAAGRTVAGIRIARAGQRECAIAARLTIAADGRRSALAFALGLACHPARPRRWAIGAYFEGVSGLSSFGEMHIRAGHYVGVAPLPGGLANACAVTEDLDQLRGHREAGAVLAGQIARDPMLRARFASARAVTRAVALGPLAVDSIAAGMPGLLLAGDAAGFIDPMTGDGLYFAMRGGELAARAALLALSGGTRTPHHWLAARRRQRFGFKRGFNRTLRLIVSQPRAVAVASRVAHLYPASIRHMVRFAGDVGRDR